MTKIFSLFGCLFAWKNAPKLAGPTWRNVVLYLRCRCKTFFLCLCIVKNNDVYFLKSCYVQYSFVIIWIVGTCPAQFNLSNRKLWNTEVVVAGCMYHLMVATTEFTYSDYCKDLLEANNNHRFSFRILEFSMSHYNEK